MTVQRVIAHPLTGPASRPVDMRTGAAFDAETYSLMKHGDFSAALTFGAEVATRLLDECRWLLTEERPVLLPVACHVTVPSCHLLAEVVSIHLNTARKGMPAAQITDVHKSSVTHIDYARSTEAERRRDLSGIAFELVEPVTGANVVVVDDIRVTGMAEQTMLSVLEGAGATRVIAAYVASCDDALAAEPSIESRLNTARVRSVLDVLPVVRSGHFRVTIRFLKRLLGEPETAEFLAQCPRPLAWELRTQAERNGRDFVAAYPEGMRALREATPGWPERPEPIEGEVWGWRMGSTTEKH
ncbi:phosphoribosyltransferase family protein [Rudaeicoccus suwonensis]|uniref:Phosphoribosyl transferase-like protein n=1 Tax=Rudaeicoccus suwonensis TaxID=657409 RepID=A0A561E497_9MICO|nr:phosphoribosyltransferase family protein [Rudaeicoccus suwonensis]TWE10435.1 phosphoribosyl transferase-like protein [Rudaeicoccus suwonensis]